MFCVDLQLTLRCTKSYRAHLLLVIREMALSACFPLSTGQKKAKKPLPSRTINHTHTHFTTANTLARKNTIHLQELYINNKGKSQQLVCSSLAGLENTGTPQGNQSAERQAPLGSENKINPHLNLSKQSFRDSHSHIAVMAQGRRVVSILEPRIRKLGIWI